MARHTSCKTGGYATEAVLRPVITHRRLGVALHIRSLPASRTALPLPRTHNHEIFVAGATSPQVGFADGIPRLLSEMRHAAPANASFVLFLAFVLLLILMMRTSADCPRSVCGVLAGIASQR